MKVSKKQKREVEELEQWFALELAKVKKQELDIMKRYDAKRTKLLRNKIFRKYVGGE